VSDDPRDVKGCLTAGTRQTDEGPAQRVHIAIANLYALRNFDAWVNAWEQYLAANELALWRQQRWHSGVSMVMVLTWCSMLFLLRLTTSL
jgi:hypothetical protein